MRIKYELYWEDIGERVIYAELDDYAWKLPEKVFRYRKKNSLYIYHHGKMAAFYSKDDSRIEAAIGRKFFSKSINAAKVGKLQVRSFNKVRNYQKKIK
ncbi:MAG: hypothetical protein HY545_01705, partial [Candidatus Doudnabacteria bacterium]|nr:hypothetical protein [Candidatus Doudnabacteria bacterium]